MKMKYKQIIVSLLLLTGVILFSGFDLKMENINKDNKPSDTGFAILELFTSQGCSSCPPADAVLAKYALQNNPNVIPLAFHVDYWNRLGWKDPFSKKEFSERQQLYAQQMNSETTYTPQLVINGTYDVLGSAESAIKEIVKEEIMKKKQNTISIKKAFLKDYQIHIEYALNEPSPNTVINLALVKKKEFTIITRGENKGLQQTSYNIVVDFKTVSSESDTSFFELKKEILSSEYFIVVYLQNSKTGTITTASKSEIN